MKEKLITFFVIILFLTISISSVASAETEKEMITNEDLHIAAFGSSMLIGIRRVGFVLNNIGEQTLTDVSWSFTVTSTDSEEVIFSDDDIIEEFSPDMSTIFSVNLHNDVGFIKLTATASCSEIESEVTNTLTVFQLGPIYLGRTFFFSIPY